MLTQILPVTDQQFAQIDCKSIDQSNLPVRFMANGQNVSVCAGHCSPKGTNVIHQLVYWGRPQFWIDDVLKALQANNPDVKFTTIFSH